MNLLVRLMPERIRRARIQQHLDQLEIWRQDGLDILTKITELTEECDEVHLEVLRIRRLLGD